MKIPKTYLVTGKNARPFAVFVNNDIVIATFDKKEGLRYKFCLKGSSSKGVKLKSLAAAVKHVKLHYDLFAVWLCTSYGLVNC